MSANGGLPIEKACKEAKEKFEKIGLDEYSEIQSKLEYVLGSYQYDGNPEGLYEIGEMALNALKEYKEQKPRAVSKKLIDDISKAIASK